MGVHCLQQGAMPSLRCVPSDLPDLEYVTLTEVACRRLYGRALTPGTDGTLSLYESEYRDDNRKTWKDDNGPYWMVDPLQTIAEGGEVAFDPDTSQAERENKLKAFRHAKCWLTNSGFRPSEAHARAQTTAARLSNGMADVAKKSAEFYRKLNRLVANGKIALFGIPVRNGRMVETPGRPNGVIHHQISPDYFMLPIAHDLFDNELGLDRTTGREQLPEPVSNPSCTAIHQLVQYKDVRLSTEHARQLVSNLNINEQKRAAVYAAVEVLGLCNLIPLGQKEWESEITAWVAANSKVTVTGRYVSGIVRKERSRLVQK